MKIEGKINVKCTTNFLPNPRLLSSTQAWLAGGLISQFLGGYCRPEGLIMTSPILFGSEADAHFSFHHIVEQQSSNPTVKLTRGLQMQSWSRKSECLFSPTISLSPIHHSPRGRLLCYITPLLSSGSTTNLPCL